MSNSSHGARHHGWLAFTRLLGRRGGMASRTAAAELDPYLDLARDWIAARGGHVERVEAHLVVGVLPDGGREVYTTSAHQAGGTGDATVLGPGAPGLDKLATAISAVSNSAVANGPVANGPVANGPVANGPVANGPVANGPVANGPVGAGYVLALPCAPRVDARALARDTLAPAATGCGQCALPEAKGTPRCPTCPLLSGRMMVAGVPAPARATRVTRQWNRQEAEFAFLLAITSSQGRSTEVARVAIDLATGDEVTPAGEAVMAGAAIVREEVRMDSEHGVARVPADGDPGLLALTLDEARARAESHLAAASQAAARLARAMALREYHERQCHVTSTYEHLLVEAPEAAKDTLAARERELRRLADAYAVRVETTLLAYARVQAPQADVEVTFAGGGAVTVTVDLARQVVAPPRCLECGQTWHVGARCAEGHVTCAACQHVCAHCGRRQCPRCAAGEYAPCPTCAGLICARCARRPCRVERSLGRAAPPRGLALATVAPKEEHAHDEPTATGEDLTVRDLESMTPDTWAACCRWILEGLGYEVEREIDVGEASRGPRGLQRMPGATSMHDRAYVCRAAAWQVAVGAEDSPLGRAKSRALVALARRPGVTQDGSSENRDPLELVQALAARTPGARPVLVTTARWSTVTRALPRRAHVPDVLVIDAPALSTLLGERAAAYRRLGGVSDAETEARARAADRTRGVIQGGLDDAREDLVAAAGETHAGGLTLDDLIAQARTAQQALLALETVLDEWESSFASAPSRDGTMAIDLEAGAFDALGVRAEHLVRALRVAARALGGAPAGGGRAAAAWLEAAREEFLGRRDALAYRCEALDPLAWRVFTAARHADKLELSVKARERARKAGYLALERLDEARTRARVGAARPPIADG